MHRVLAASIRPVDLLVSVHLWGLAVAGGGVQTNGRLLAAAHLPPLPLHTEEPANNNEDEQEAAAQPDGEDGHFVWGKCL